MRSAFKIWLGLAVLVMAGCTNMMTKKAIESFSASLEGQDLKQLRETSSSGFEEKALRIAEAPKDLKQLRIPTDKKFKIVKVENTDSQHRVATVTVGDDKKQQQTLQYQLTKDAQSHQWVVDDLIISPRADGENPPSIAEQMDLLLTSREFIAAWHGEDQQQKLAFCTTEFSDVLKELPSKWFDRLAEQTVGTGRQRVARPEARINGEMAVVVFPHPDGELFIELKKLDSWLINDAALQTKSDSGGAIPSVKKLARTLNHSAAFLSAYAAGDREKLSEVATHDFYDRCLIAAELETVPLPVAELLTTDYQLRFYKERRELMFDSHGTTYMLTLKPVDGDISAREGKELDVRVDEVTIFEQEGKEVKRISAMFLSHAVVQLYGESLFKRDVSSLQKMSSTSFNEMVWDQETAKLFAEMPFPEIESPDVHIIATVFRGNATEITATQGTRAVTYVLNLQNSRMVVDDIVLSSSQRPTSLKKNLELLLPMYAFASSLHRRDLPELLTNSADGLDRIVWRQVDHVPDLNHVVVTDLMQPVVAIETGEPWAVVKLGDPKQGTEVRLVREGGRYVVHDVSSGSGDALAGRYNMLQSLRQRLAVGEIPTKVAPNRAVILQAGGRETDIPEPISPAVYETVVPE